MTNRLKSIMDPDEKRVRQEDCNEDTMGIGILTLTNKRVAFDKKHARVMDFSGSIGDTILDVPLENITKVWKEGLLMKKVCFTQKQMMVKRHTSLVYLATEAGEKHLKRLWKTF